MPYPYPAAVDAEGPVSEGSNTNPVFAEPARVGAAGYVDISPPTGYQHPNYVIPGIPGVQLSTDGLFFEVVGNALTVGAFTGVRRIWLKIAATADPAPKLYLPAEGWIAYVTNAVTGSTGAVAVAAGAVNEVELAGGAAGSVGGAVGGVVSANVRSADGSAGAETGLAGAVNETEAGTGASGADAGVVGAVASTVPVDGSAGAVAQAVGAATLAVGATPVAYRSKSASSTTSNSLARAWPTGTTTNDVLVALVISYGTGEATPPVPTGWTEITNYGGGGSIATMLCYRRVQDGDTQSTTFNSGSYTTHLNLAVTILAFSGCITSGSPVRDFTNTHDSVNNTQVVFGDQLDYLTNDYVLSAMAQRSGQAWSNSGNSGLTTDIGLTNTGGSAYAAHFSGLAAAADGVILSTQYESLSFSSANPHIFGLVLKAS